MKVTFNYDDNVTASELPTEEVSISNLGITINFEQSSDALVKNNGEVADYRLYHQGDNITLNNEDYYVIENSGADKDYVVALKENPLTVAEVNLYGVVGTTNNHVNKYSSSSQGTSQNSNGYGAITYYTSETCGYINGSSVTTGCTALYDNSDIKYLIDNWIISEFPNNELAEVNAYKARLITENEYNLITISFSWKSTSVPYWTSTIWSDKAVKAIKSNGDLMNGFICSNMYVVRPVINVYKSALETNNNNNNE